MKTLVKKMEIMGFFKTLPYLNAELLFPEKGPAHVWGRTNTKNNNSTIWLYPKLFEMTYESIQHCLLHEIAHIIQIADHGTSGHNSVFQAILDKLIEKYGTPSIKAAKVSGTIALSNYKKDIN